MNRQLRIRRRARGTWAVFLLGTALAVAGQSGRPAPAESLPDSAADGFASEPARQGEPIVFRIDPERSWGTFDGAKNVTLLVYQDLLKEPWWIPMVMRRGTWEGSFTVKDTSAKALFYAVSIEAVSGETRTFPQRGDLFSLPLRSGAGNPLPGAHQDVALSYTGISDLRHEDWNRAEDECRKELLYFPGNAAARSLLYSILLKRSGNAETVRRKIELEVDSLLLLPENRFAAMEFAVGAYRMLGLSDKAQVIEKSLIEQNPRGEQAAIKRFSEILQTEDPARKIERLNGFLVDFPGTRVAETALSQLVGAAIQANDTTTLVRTADRLLEKAASQTGADALAAAAGVFADSRMELDRAFACIQKAMDLVQSGTAGKDALSTEARYRDILGWILFRKGDLTGALNELRMAERNILQATVFFHLGAVLDASGDRDGAAMYFARAAAYRGGVGDAAGARFREVWILANKDTLLAGRFLDEQARWVEEAGKRKILSKRSAWPAPDFRLEDARGGWVRLSDQKGNVVVLCVWGTWSKTSLSLLETLEEMADAYGQKVLFLTVAMDHDRSTVLRFLRQRRMILPVLINEGMENTYRIEGVPMVYVIDTKGEVLFTHRGFRPDLGRILSVELDDLLGPEPK